MPKFAANLTMLFTEQPFLDRFAAASHAGFRAIEFLFPYDHPAQQVADTAKAAGLASIVPAGLDILPADCGLPRLPSFAVNLHVPRDQGAAATEFARYIRDGLLRHRHAA